MQQPESKISRRVRVAVCRTGRATIAPNRVVGNAYTKEGKSLGPYGLGVGSPDYVGILHGSGRAFCLEIKTEKGRLSKEQKRWHATHRKRGGFVAVARSPEEALQALARAEQGACE